MKKILLLVFILYSIVGFGQAGNLIHAYIPTWSTSARPTLSNGDMGINTDSSKLQFAIGSTIFTVGGSGGGGTTYTASQSITLTGTNFPLTNDNASPGNSMLYGTNSSGTLGWYAQPGGLSGLTTGYLPVATSSTALGNSNLYTTGKELTVTFGTSNTYADYIGYGAGNANNRFNAAINILNDSIGFTNVGGVASQANSAVFQVNGVTDLLSNLWVASNSSTSGMEITANQIIAKLSTNNIYFNTGSGPSYPAIFFPSGNSAFGANASDNGISVIQATSTTLPQLGGYYNSTNYFKMQANSSGNLTVTASGGTITLAGNTKGSTTTNLATFAHFVGNSATPTIAAGPGAGTSPTISILGTDQDGLINLTTGTLPSGTGATVVTITFSLAYANNVYISLTPAGLITAALNGATAVYPGTGSSSFTINSGATALTAATSYSWFYHIGAN
jgi:hypothetical protein